MLCHPGTSHNDDIGTSFDIGDGKAEGAVAGATFMN